MSDPQGLQSTPNEEALETIRESAFSKHTDATKEISEKAFLFSKEYSGNKFRV